MLPPPYSHQTITVPIFLSNEWNDLLLSLFHTVGLFFVVIVGIGIGIGIVIGVGVGIGRPKMLSPRLRIGSAGAGVGSPSPGPVTRSSNRKKEALPTLTLSPKIAPSYSDDDRDRNGSSGGAVGINRSNESSNSDDNGNEYDSDTCPTLELSSPLRSRGVSSRDLEVLTPLIARAAGRTTGNDSASGGYSRGSDGNNHAGADGGSECGDSDVCPTPELSSPLRSAESASLCRRRLEEVDREGYGDGEDDKDAAAPVPVPAAELTACDGPLELVSEEEYARVSMWC